MDEAKLSAGDGGLCRSTEEACLLVALEKGAAKAGRRRSGDGVLRDGRRRPSRRREAGNILQASEEDDKVVGGQVQSPASPAFAHGVGGLIRSRRAVHRVLDFRARHFSLPYFAYFFPSARSLLSVLLSTAAAFLGPGLNCFPVE